MHETVRKFSYLVQDTNLAGNTEFVYFNMKSNNFFKVSFQNIKSVNSRQPTGFHDFTDQVCNFASKCTVALSVIHSSLSNANQNSQEMYRQMATKTLLRTLQQVYSRPTLPVISFASDLNTDCLCFRNEFFAEIILY